MTISVIIAFILLTLFANFYLGLPSNVDDFDKITNFHYPAHAFFSALNEGFSQGTINNEGYNNLFDYEKKMDIDVLLIGTSHMEAFQVMPCYNTANVLSSLSKKKIYNIGIRGHSFSICANNFENAVKKYQPSEFVILETMENTFTNKELNEILSHSVSERGTFHQENLRAGGLRGFYAKYLREYMHKHFFPFLQMFAMRITMFFSNNKNEIEQSYMDHNNPFLLSQVLKRMAETVKNFSRGAKLIIAYHPAVELEKDGSLKILGNSEAVKVFADACEQNGVYFIDMSERFLSEYEKNYTVPNGFFNTSVASGHMNKDGHRMFAEEIYKLMQKIEGVNN